jgi:broad specificity phosphatase PhoE
MKIYFVRHGSTDSLEQKINQPDDEPLNERGLHQARKLGKRFANTKIDLVISSPHLRAMQTAKEISMKVQVNPLFAEVRKAKELIGKSKDNEKVKVILKKIGEMYLVDPSWHYSDEENFEDLKLRGLKAINYLQNLNLESVVLVSHGNFMTLLLGLMLFGEKYSVDIFLRLKNFMRQSDTGVSIFTYEDNNWRLQCWNDTSHLHE